MATSSSQKASFEMRETLSPASTHGSGHNGSTQTQSNTPGLWKNIKLYPKITGYMIGLAMGIILVGYDVVIVGTVTALPAFQRDFGELHQGKWIIPASWLALWSALSPVGSALGGAFAGWFQDKVGRKWSMALGSAICAVGIAIVFTAYLPADVNARRGVFLAGKITIGIAIGVVLATTQTYMSEVAPVSLRGSTLALVPTSILIGQLVGALVIFASSHVEGVRQYLAPFASQWIFSAIPFIMAFIIPESPAYLINRGQHDAARKSGQRLYTTAIDMATELERLKLSIEHERQLAAEVTFLTCFRGINLRRTAIIIFASSIPNLFGLPLLAQASYFMQTVGMSAGTSLIFLILGILLGLVANGFGIWIMSRLGRRLITMCSLTATTVLWLSMGIAGCWSGPVTIWYTAVTLMAIVVVCGLGAWPASTALAAETSTLNLRAKSLGISVCSQQVSNVILNLVLPYIFNPDAGNLRVKTGFVYSGICLITTLVTWFIVPELKDRSAIEIDRMFELKLPTRSFRGWRDTVASRDL